jgi:hypothetical protein
MSLHVRIARTVQRRLAAWRLPDAILVDVHLRLTDELANDAPLRLVRARTPFDGMIYRFSLVDPGDRFSEYLFVFQVYYSQDEETLEVVRGSFVRRQTF